MGLLVIRAENVPLRFDTLPLADEVHLFAKNGAVGTVPEHAFKSYRGLTKVVFIGCWEIESCAFRGCVELAVVDASRAAILKVGFGAFAGCLNLTEINFYAEQRGAFLCDEALREYKLSLAVAAFAGCISLVKVTLPSVGAVGERHGKKMRYPSLKFRENHCVPPLVILTVANPLDGRVPCLGTFWGCTSLTSVLIYGNESSNLSLQCGTFTGAPLSTFSVVGSVKSIDLDAFDGRLTQFKTLFLVGNVHLSGTPPDSCFGVWVQGTITTKPMPPHFVAGAARANIHGHAITRQLFLTTAKAHFRQTVLQGFRFLTDRNKCTILTALMALRKRNLDSLSTRLVLSYLRLGDL